MARDVGGALSLYLDGQGMDDHLAQIRHGRARGYVKDHRRRATLVGWDPREHPMRGGTTRYRDEPGGCPWKEGAGRD